jgi:hypothetical protein
MSADNTIVQNDPNVQDQPAIQDDPVVQDDLAKSMAQDGETQDIAGTFAIQSAGLQVVSCTQRNAPTT